MTPTERARAYRHRCAQKLRRWRRGPCEHCHRSSTPREFAHVAPTPLSGRGRGLTCRYHDIRKYPHCYALLCGPCHQAQDLGVFKFTRVKGPPWLAQP